MFEGECFNGLAMLQTATLMNWARKYALTAGYCIFLTSLALDWHVNEARTIALLSLLAQLWLTPKARQRLLNSTQLRIALCFPVIAAAAWLITPYGEHGLKTIDWVVCLSTGYVASVCLERKAILLLVLIPAICAAASICLALWTFFTAENMKSLLSNIKLKMYVEHPNRYGLLTAISAAIAIGLFPLLARREKFLLAIMLAALALLCWYSQSRAAVFSLFGTLCIAMLFFIRYTPKQGLLVLLAVACIFGIGILTGGERIVSTVTKSSWSFLLNGREDIWEAAWEIFQKSPWVGFGVDSFRQTLEVHLNLPENLARFPDIRAQSIFWHAHQLVLGLLAETGLAGLIVFITLSGRAIYSGIKKCPLALAPLLILILYWICGLGGYGLHRSWDTAIIFTAIGLIDGMMPAMQQRPTNAKASSLQDESKLLEI